MKPLRGKVIVKRARLDEVSPGGILLAGLQGMSLFVDVIAVHRDSELKVGDRVVLGKWAGKKIPTDAGELLSISEKDAEAVLG